jgi:succinate dehydrogenase flavoprotein subunit
MYLKITDENPYQVPMRIYPAVHYTMGGLWVDYDLMSNLPGLFVIGEANFSDHGANRLGASALMQGLADGYFILPYTVGGYLSSQQAGSIAAVDKPEFEAAKAQVKTRIERLLAVNGTRSVDSFHKELGHLMWHDCGMSRNAKGLAEAKAKIPELRERFWSDVRVLGENESFNVSLEKAGRVADFMEFAEVFCDDAMARTESCGGHFREESQTEEGEALRDDENFSHVSVWEYGGEPGKETLHKEPLEFENVQPSVRSYR